tara:strand:- start:1240 stop:2349 length:1110 start_codon:yes stop_codon:yes gene_type:complete
MTAFEKTSSLPSPSLLFDADRIEDNLDRMLEMVGGVTSRLRPHIKTHKCAEVLDLQLAKGINQVKCATIAEAELSAQRNIPDVLIACPLVGTNARRLRELIDSYKGTRFSAIVDSPEGVAALTSEGARELPVYIDLDCGMHRTGIAPGQSALNLVRSILAAPALTFAGVHAYDGHIHEPDLTLRTSAFEEAMSMVDGFLELLNREDIEVPAVVAGGSPTFALHAKRADTHPQWQCSPGTPVLWDAGYALHFPDLPFEPACFLLARVISRPGNDLACLDLGHKAVSAENPLENRVRFQSFGNLEFVSQSEEHLVVRCTDSDRMLIGNDLIGIPYHVCPTVALHQRAHVVRDGAVTDEIWAIAARDRVLTL